MTVTTTKLTRAAGLSAVVGGLLFIAVQINHPLLDATFTTTTEYAVRETMKIFMAVFSLIGITGIYLRQVRQTGVLGLIGYVVLGVGYLAIFSVQVVGVFVLPTLAASQPGFVNDVLAVATSRHPESATSARCRSSSRAAASPTSSVASSSASPSSGPTSSPGGPQRSSPLAPSPSSQPLVLPELTQRLFAIPVSVALIGLGFSLWREQRTQNTRPMASPVSSQLDPTGAK